MVPIPAFDDFRLVLAARTSENRMMKFLRAIYLAACVFPEERKGKMFQ